MSSSITLKGAQLLPLWRRRIPKYPVYWKGDPQLRVFMPQFWMKLIKPDYDIPKNQVHFEVHPQVHWPSVFVQHGWSGQSSTPQPHGAAASAIVLCGWQVRARVRVFVVLSEWIRPA
ncbi:hypothetical protein PoB_005989200 [Plakobranchus ocellatus]|uniref:Uncharacterized protein n=1 Tax=Plakobranchus ocellatus TaxID=259542 RepID=A0AAV4CMW3_9GAST|nr:hypothetical protein PoB_005989200 [Plakobranchus ocellatus]